MSNGYPNDSYSVSDNELMLYIDQAIAQGIVGKAFEFAKVSGVLEMPEAYLITFQLTDPIKDPATSEWYSSLPQPPISLPLGYSITRVYATDNAFGVSEDFWPIRNKRTAYRKLLPSAPGGTYRVENNRIWLRGPAGATLSGIPFYVQMPTSRTSDITQDMNLPDDVIQAIFDNVTAELTRRYQMPKDIIHDDLPAGNNNVTSQRV